MAKYGWRPSPPDQRDFKFSRPVGTAIPGSVDLRAQFPDPYDQLNLGSCTANACAGLIEREVLVTKYPWPFTPARLFIYYNSRAIEGTTEYDSGATLRDTIKAVNSKGTCPEHDNTGHDPGWWWTYSDDSFKYRLIPLLTCYDHAKLHKALKYESVPLTRDGVLGALAANKPFMFGFTVYESFEDDSTAKTGIVTIPGPNEGVLGGHAVCAVGYELNKPMGSQGVTDWVIVRNSWGTSWGDKGYCYFPLQMLIDPNVTSDAWAIDLIGYSA